MSGLQSFWDKYQISAETTLTNISAVRLELLTDDRLPDRGPGRAPGGNMVLTEFTLRSSPMGFTLRTNTIQIGSAQADFSSSFGGIATAIDTDTNTGWIVSPFAGYPHVAIFNASQPFGLARGTKLTFVLDHSYGYSSAIGRFRLAITDRPGGGTLDPVPLEIAQMLRTPAELKTDEQKRLIAAYYRTLAPELEATRHELESLSAEQASLLESNQQPIRWLMSHPGIASFGLDPGTGEVLMADLNEGVIRRLTAVSDAGPPLPPTLQETHAFEDLATLTPSPGIVPYDVNVSFWSDNAAKRRWFSIPELQQKIEFHANAPWILPEGIVWIKQFDLQLTNGQAASTVPVETRFLVKNASGVFGFSYQWDGSGTNALLVPEAGMTRTFLIHNGLRQQEQVWHYPSRTDCLRCHTAGGGYALAFNTPQLNRSRHDDANAINQLDALAEAGYFTTPIPSPDTLLALAASSNALASAEFRVRSYLQANCAQCHFPGSGVQALWTQELGRRCRKHG